MCALFSRTFSKGTQQQHSAKTDSLVPAQLQPVTEVLRRKRHNRIQRASQTYLPTGHNRTLLFVDPGGHANLIGTRDRTLSQRKGAHHSPYTAGSELSNSASDGTVPRPSTYW
jgi:hypothetical protein